SVLVEGSIACHPGEILDRKQSRSNSVNGGSALPHCLCNSIQGIVCGRGIYARPFHVLLHKVANKALDSGIVAVRIVRWPREDYPISCIRANFEDLGIVETNTTQKLSSDSQFLSLPKDQANLGVVTG